MNAPGIREIHQDIPTVPGQPPAAPPGSGWPVTVAVLTRDEERSIRRCLDSVLAASVDRLLVLDTGSTERDPGDRRQLP